MAALRRPAPFVFEAKAEPAGEATGWRSLTILIPSRTDPAVVASCIHRAEHLPRVRSPWLVRRPPHFAAYTCSLAARDGAGTPLLIGLLRTLFDHASFDVPKCDVRASIGRDWVRVLVYHPLAAPSVQAYVLYRAIGPYQRRNGETAAGGIGQSPLVPRG